MTKLTRRNDEPTGWDKLAVWHQQKELHIRARKDYMPTAVSYASEWRRNGCAGYPPDYSEYVAAREQWYASAVAEYKHCFPSPMSGAGNMVDLV